MEASKMQQSNNAKALLLKEVLKELGYENDKPLSDWVQNIMQNKEDFKKMYIPEENKRSRDSHEKQSHMKVWESAKVLIGNLCLLKRYIKLFPKQRSRENDNRWEPYEYLLKKKSENDKEKIKKNCEEFKSSLEREEKINTRTKEELQSFYEAIIFETNGIDIHYT
jgi:hypothetical protein